MAFAHLPALPRLRRLARAVRTSLGWARRTRGAREGRARLEPRTQTRGLWPYAVGVAGGAFVCHATLAACDTALADERGEVDCKEETHRSSRPVDKPVKRVVILVAMEQEARPFVEKHSLRKMDTIPWNSSLPMVAYSGYVDHLECHLVWAGSDPRYKVNNVATTASAVSAYVSINAFKPDLVVSAGTAGAFGAMGAEIGDVYLSTKCIFHHRRIPDDFDSREFGDYGLGNFRCPYVGRLARLSGCKLGVVSTSDSLDYTPKDLEIMLAEGASVKEMEAASIGWVCHHLDVPFFAVKSITDIIDGTKPTQDEFFSNLSSASEALQTKLTAILKLVQGKPLHTWRFG